jgi:outer membrane protein assembly factor BamB
MGAPLPPPPVPPQGSAPAPGPAAGGDPNAGMAAAPMTAPPGGPAGALPAQEPGVPPDVLRRGIRPTSARLPARLSAIFATPRPESRRSYATPVIWTVDGKQQVVVAGTLRVIGYDLETGKEIWTVRGLARLVNPTPVIGPDNVLYVSTWVAGGDADDRFDLPPFAEMLKRYDTNGNGTLEREELTNTILKDRFAQFDVDKDGHITEAEYEQTRAICNQAHNRLIAIRPGCQGEVTKSHVIWEVTKGLPYMPSPVLHEGKLFIVKDGGLLSCLDAQTGKLLSQERIYGTGRYYSSPVVVNGKLYLANQEGRLSVVEAAPGTRLLHRIAFGEEAYATPAVTGGRMYFRTKGHLYCFGREGSP